MIYDIYEHGDKMLMERSLQYAQNIYQTNWPYMDTQSSKSRFVIHNPQPGDLIGGNCWTSVRWQWPATPQMKWYVFRNRFHQTWKWMMVWFRWPLALPGGVLFCRFSGRFIFRGCSIYIIHSNIKDSSQRRSLKLSWELVNHDVLIFGCRTSCRSLHLFVYLRTPEKHMKQHHPSSNLLFKSSTFFFSNLDHLNNQIPILVRIIPRILSPWLFRAVHFFRNGGRGIFERKWWLETWGISIGGWKFCLKGKIRGEFFVEGWSRVKIRFERLQPFVATWNMSTSSQWLLFKFCLSRMILDDV